MDEQEKIEVSLTEFDKTPSKDIPPILEDFLKTVAKTGKTVFPWEQLKSLFVQKILQVMEHFNKEEPCERPNPFPNVENAKFDDMQKRIVEALEKFNSAPFTVQRLCELVTQPRKHYTKCDKFMRGIEKNVMVVSTVDPNGRKIVSESRVMVNGLDVNGQPQDHNEFTDEQPFVPIPQIDWVNNHATTVWPTPGLGPVHPNHKKQERQEDPDNDDVFKFKTKDEEERECTSKSAKPESTTNLDGVQEDTNSNNSNDQNVCVTDSVKLPQASSLFSNLENTESLTASSRDANVQKDSSVAAADSVLSDDSKQSDSALSEQTGNKTSDTESDTSSEDSKDAESDSMESKSVSSESGTEMQEEKSEVSVQELETKRKEQGSLVRSASDEGEGPPEKRIRLTPTHDKRVDSPESTDQKTSDSTSQQTGGSEITSPKADEPVSTSQQTDEQEITSQKADKPESTSQQADESVSTSQQPTQSESSENTESDKDNVTEMSESLKEGCSDDDTMPFIPTSNQEFTEADSCQSVSSFSDNKSNPDQSASSLKNEDDSAKSTEKKVTSECETAETDFSSVSSLEKPSSTTESEEESSKCEEQKEEPKSSESTNEKSDSKNSNTEKSDNKSEDEAMDTDSGSEKTEKQPNTDESEPMDQE